MKVVNEMHAVRFLIMFAVVAVIIPLTAVACSSEAEKSNESGNEHFSESSYEDALTEYQLAQVDEPDAAEPYYNAANTYNRMSQPEEVLAQTKQSVKTAGAGLASKAWYNLGNAYFDAEQWPQAVEAYQDALRLNSPDEDAKVNLELALQNMQQCEQEQQQEEQSEGDQEEQEGQEGQSEQEESQQSESESASSEEQEAQESEAAQHSEETEGMTEEQAVQLLQALLDESQTLQEKLQEIHQSHGPSSEQDW